MGNTLREKIEKFTVHHRQNKNHSQEPTEVVVVPTGGDLARGFEIARELLEKNLTVRIIGEGVTLRQTQPSWIEQADNLWLTEYGAYHSRELLATNRILQREIEEWLREILGEVAPGYDSGKIFFGTASDRLFELYRYFGGVSVLHQIIKSNGAANYHFVRAPRVRAGEIRHLVARFGGTLAGLDATRFSFIRLRILIYGFALIAASLLKQIVSYVKEKPARRKLAELRRQNPINRKCETWAVLSADNQRMNSMVARSIALPALQSGKPVGILLVGNLIPGETFQAESRIRNGKEFWTGLRDFENHLSNCRIEQIVSPQSIGDLIRLIFLFVKKSAAAVLRLAAAPTRAGREFKFDFEEDLIPLLKLFTNDVLRVLTTQIAVGRIAAQNDFTETTVSFSFHGIIPYTVADLILQRAGAMTVDFVHGITGVWAGMIPSPSTVREVQVKPDIEIQSSLAKQKISVAPTVRPVQLKQKSGVAKKARNILLTSSYALHFSEYHDQTPLLPFQSEMLGAIPIIREMFPDRFEFRWRAHPWDSETAVQQAAAEIGAVEVSKNRSLAEDLAWADIVIANSSSVLIETLLERDVPVFLHVLPLLDDLPTTESFARSRRFFLAAEIRQPFAELIKNLDSGNAEATACERATRAAWFAAVETPH